MANWMGDVAAGIEKEGRKGIFKRAAARAGMSTAAYAKKKEHAPGKIGKRARLAEAFAKAKH
jgi:hypothetical protein